MCFYKALSYSLTQMGLVFSLVRSDEFVVYYFVLVELSANLLGKIKVGA